MDIEKRQRHAGLVAQMRRIVTGAQGRAYTDQERQDWDRLDGEQERLATEIRAEDPLTPTVTPARVGDAAGLTALEADLATPLPTKAARRTFDYPMAPGVVADTRPGLSGEQRLADHVPVSVPAGVPRDALSFGRAVRALVTGRWDGAGAELRVMGSGTGGAGGWLIPTPLSLDVIDLARAQTRVISAGARTIPMTAKTLDMARLEKDAVPTWKPENQSATPSDLQLGRLTLTAHTLVAIVKLSVELAEDAPNAPSLIERSFAESLALALDYAALRGDPTVAGEDQPRGIRNTAGVTLTPAGAALANYDLFSQAAQNLAAANAPATEPIGIICHPRTLGTLDRLRDTQNNPLRQPESWGRMTKLSTTQVPINQGVGTNESEAYVAVWSALYLGMRTDLMIELSREAADSTGSAFRDLQVWMRAYLRADVLVSREPWFNVITGILP
jgi:HK97 family phage major capsid protein